MESLLLNVLGQEVKIDKKKTQAILVRDIHDLYKYGIIPAPIEDRMFVNKLIEYLNINSLE